MMLIMKLFFLCYIFNSIILFQKIICVNNCRNNVFSNKLPAPYNNFLLTDIEVQKGEIHKLSMRDLLFQNKGQLCQSSIPLTFSTHLPTKFLNRNQSTLSTPNSNTLLSKYFSKTPISQLIYPSISASNLTPILDTINYPHDLKKLSIQQLKDLSNELRWDVIHSVSQTGGHLSASLGVIELTLALHHVFDTPNDKLIWDVSHQAYAHKIITGRRNSMKTVRKFNGLSGFAKREESIYDPFGAGHSSTSISAAQGMSVAGALQNKKHHYISVIGDGAITGGMAFEAMNFIGFLKSRVLVILNDNGQVSLPTGSPTAGGTGPAGALSTYTAKLLTSRRFLNFREAAKRVSQLFPESLRETAAKIDEFGRGMITGGTLFEELGFYYVGPVDGHDLENLVAILKNIKNNQENKPVLLHIKTHKGFGYEPAMNASDKMHGVLQFDIQTGYQLKSAYNPAFTEIFANTLCKIGQNDSKVVAITAAMPGGTGVCKFGSLFPNRTFDVGIAEQHAVTFSGGLASEGMKPFCCIYSTFLQRAYDQIIHDICLQKLPVRFIVDRAGLVGPDGATHQGSYDLTYLGTVPNIIIMSPSDELELKRMIETSYQLNHAPSVIRFPRSVGYGITYLNKMFKYNIKSLPDRAESLEIGKGRIIYNSRFSKPKKVAILSLGTRLADSLEAAYNLESRFDDLSVTVADARFLRPLDEDLVKNLALNNDYLITIEEGAIGGFGSHVIDFLINNGILESTKTIMRSLHLPDYFIEHATRQQQLKEASLTSLDITKKISDLLIKA